MELSPNESKALLVRLYFVGLRKKQKPPEKRALVCLRKAKWFNAKKHNRPHVIEFEISLSGLLRSFRTKSTHDQAVECVTGSLPVKYVNVNEIMR